MKFQSETDTVVKRILPYLRRRGYAIETDVDFETATKHPERYTKGYIDLLVTCGKPKPLFLIEAKRSTRTLTANDAKQAIDYGIAQKVLFVVVTTAMTEEDWTIVLRVFAASRSRRGDKGRNDTRKQEKCTHPVRAALPR
jgi:hypothetical protein